MKIVYCKNCKFSSIYSTKGITLGMKIGGFINLAGLLVNDDSCFHDVSIKETPCGKIKQTPSEFWRKSKKNNDGKCQSYKRKWWKFWVK